MSRPAAAGLVPERTADPDEARRLLERDGVAVLIGAGDTRADAARATALVLGDRLRAHREPVDIGTNPIPAQVTFFDPKTRIVNSNPDEDQSAHTDGYMSYGAAYPDVITLLCSRQAEAGGESGVLDGYRILEEVDDPEFTAFLGTVPIEQSTPGGVPCQGPIAARTERGKVALRCHDHQRPIDGTENADKIAALIDRWQALVFEAARAAPRFLLRPGELICLDNYRMFHLRDRYVGRRRMLRRMWTWTDQALALPDRALLDERRLSDLVFLD